MIKTLILHEVSCFAEIHDFSIEYLQENLQIVWFREEVELHDLI